MLVFQAQKEKKKEGEPLTATQRQFLESATAAEFPLISDSEEFASAISAIDKSFKAHGLSDFISTLTPGAQNAIYAASFAWGYENAERHVKSAMKLAEANGAASSEEKSRAVMDSLQKSESSGSQSEISKAIWSFYNEDMKETQVQTAKSETITEKEKAVHEMCVPQTASEAVAMGISQESLSPAVLYCASSQQAVEQQHAEQLEVQKKEEMARLVTPGQLSEAEKKTAHEAVIEDARQLRVQIEEKKKMEEEMKTPQIQALLAKNGVSEEVALAALIRKEEVLREIAENERAIKQTLKALESLRTDDEEQLKKLISKLLPPVLAYDLLRRKNAFFKRINISRQLSRWLAFCGESKKKLAKMPLSRLIKLVSLSKLFG